MSDPFAKFKSRIRESAAVPTSLIEETQEEQNNELTEDFLPGVEPPREIPEQNEFQFVFFPKNDITAYDLARILALTQLMVTDDIYEKVPDELKKHFTRFTEIIQPQSN